MLRSRASRHDRCAGARSLTRYISTVPGLALPPLSEWESFYVITGSSAAALTGLMFVVVALRTEAKVENAEAGVRAFGSPTVVHFCAVLLLAAILSIPGHTAASLATCVGATGIAGVVLTAWVLVHLFIGIHNAWDAAVWIAARR
jgi:hypothetical protein